MVRTARRRNILECPDVRVDPAPPGLLIVSHFAGRARYWVPTARHDVLVSLGDALAYNRHKRRAETG
jgi:hypothetical protein